MVIKKINNMSAITSIGWLALVGWLIASFSGQVSQANELTRGYKQLNRHFIVFIGHNKHTTSYFYEAEKELIRAAKLKWPESMIKGNGYRQAISEFINLRSVYEEINCDNQEFEHLIEVAKATGGHSFTMNPNQLPPVDRILHDISLNRAEKCRPVWPREVKRIYDSLRSQLIVLAEFKRVTLAKEEGMTDRQYMEWLIDFDFEKDKAKYSDVYEHLTRLNDALPEANKKETKCDYSRLYMGFLLKPCREYLIRLRKPISQAIFDAEMYEGKSGFLFGKGPEMIKFYKIMANAKACVTVQSQSFFMESHFYWLRRHKKEGTECSKSGQANAKQSKTPLTSKY